VGIGDKNGPAPVGSMIGRRATRKALSDATVLAGWRPPPRVITDLADPAGVSDCTVVLDVLGVSGQRAGTSGGLLPRRELRPATTPPCPPASNRDCRSPRPAGRRGEVLKAKGNVPGSGEVGA
jgi:hypothetical protein